MRLPVPSVIVLIGASGSGKTTWAHEHFAANEVLSSDALRAVVGIDESDQRAGNDAFAVLADVLERRCRRGLTTVVDSVGLDPRRRKAYVSLARRFGLPAHAVLFATDPAECRRRNKTKSRPVPSAVLTSQIKAFAGLEGELPDEEGWDGVHVAGDEGVHLVAKSLFDAPAAATRQREDPMTMRFGLHMPRFTTPGGSATLPADLATVARSAEECGFRSLWVMDHHQQIPQVGRAWDPMLEAYTTLGFLAGQTSTATLGTLVTGVTYRNVGLLAKCVATLDVLSGGRAVCGIGAAWFEREHRAYGWEFPPPARRLDLLEDALQALPLLWGPGSPGFEGRVSSIPEAVGYPRPIQDPVPILVGGGGERRTLRLVAQHAHACNLFGEPDDVRHKLDVLRKHCADVGRTFDEIEVTHLGEVPDGAGVDDLIGRYRQFAEAGVQHAILTVPSMYDEGVLERLAPLIEAFA